MPFSLVCWALLPVSSMTSLEMRPKLNNWKPVTRLEWVSWRHRGSHKAPQGELLLSSRCLYLLTGNGVVGAADCAWAAAAAAPPLCSQNPSFTGPKKGEMQAILALVLGYPSLQFGSIFTGEAQGAVALCSGLPLGLWKMIWVLPAPDISSYQQSYLSTSPLTSGL